MGFEIKILIKIFIVYFIIHKTITLQIYSFIQFKQ